MKKSLIFLIFNIVIIENSYSSNFSDFNRNVKNYNKKLEIFSDQGHKKANFRVLIADNDKKRQYGLMNLERLGDENGMLFLFEKRDIIYMWMKNTLIPLDMIFIDGDKVVSIHKNAKPLKLDVISSKKKVNRVLEVNSGIVDRFEIEVGDKVSF